MYKTQEKRHRLHLERYEEHLDDILYDQKQQQALLRKWRSAKSALDHEWRVVQELEKAHMQVNLSNKSSKATQKLVADTTTLTVPDDVKEWFEYRKHALQLQVDTLTEYVQEESKHSVLERYGPGPYNVRFTVELPGAVQGDFTVQLAPLMKMPHSIHFFLDMVTAQVWDGTVFTHHERVDHVMSSSPINFKTQKVKVGHSHDLGWSNLGFPEYSQEIPHKKYTVGFADQGPTFYINTADNRMIHGPDGNQKHHRLPGDADPCFGEVISGFDVVDKLMEFGMEESTLRRVKSEKSGDVSKGGNEHVLTHIILVELLKE